MHEFSRSTKILGLWWHISDDDGDFIVHNIASSNQFTVETHRVHVTSTSSTFGVKIMQYLSL
jgi:hypothetical protein